MGWRVGEAEASQKTPSKNQRARPRTLHIMQRAGPKEAYFNSNGCHGDFNSIVAPSSLTTSNSAPLIRNLA